MSVLLRQTIWSRLPNCISLISGLIDGISMFNRSLPLTFGSELVRVLASVHISDHVCDLLQCSSLSRPGWSQSSYCKPDESVVPSKLIFHGGLLASGCSFVVGVFNGIPSIHPSIPVSFTLFPPSVFSTDPQPTLRRMLWKPSMTQQNLRSLPCGTAFIPVCFPPRLL